MKHLKLYENIKKPQIGDHILDFGDDIGRLTGIDEGDQGGEYQIKHIYGDWINWKKDADDDIYSYSITYDDVKFFGTEDECRAFLEGEKYNI